MRIFKWFFGVFFFLLMVALIIVGYVALTFNPNEHKDALTEIIKEKTGRDLVFEGDIDMSFYPWLGMSFGKTNVSNAEGFEAEKFAVLEGGSARLQLIPLLKKKLVVDKVLLDGAEVWLERNKDGVTNWDDILERFESDAPAAEGTGEPGLLGNSTIAGLEVQNSTIHWHDQASSDKVSVSNLNLDTGDLVFNEETQLQGDFHFELQDPVIQGQAKLSAGAVLDFKPPYLLIKPELELNLQGIDLQAQNIQADITADQLEFIDGRTKLSVPNIEYVISNMPSLGEQAKGIVKGSMLSLKAADIVITDAEISTDVEGSALPGNTLVANIQSKSLNLVDKVLSLSDAKMNADFTGAPWPQEKFNAAVSMSNFDYHTTKSTLKIPSFSADALDMQVSGSANATDVTSEIKLNGELDIQDFVLKDLLTRLEIDLPEMSNETLQSANLKASYTATENSVSLSKLVAQVDGIDITGSMQATDIRKDIKLEGKVDVAEFVLKDLAKRFEIELPEMSDEAWQRASIKGNYKATKNSMGMNNMTAMIDGVDWTGSAFIDDLENKKLSFDLAAKSLDMNRLIPPEQAEALKDNEETSADSQDAVNAIKIPVEPFKTWDVKGKASLGKFIFGNIESTNLKASIDLQDGLLKLSPTQLEVFGGKNNGQWTLDVRDGTPHLTAKESFTNIDLAKMADAMWSEQRMTGTITGQWTIDTRGKTIGEMRAALSGDLDAKVSNGILKGFDLNYALANAVSLYKQRALSDVSDTKQTPFTSLSASGKIIQGILRNEDFIAVMPRMRVRGQGSFSFIDTGINYAVNTDVLETKASTPTGETAVELSLDELVGATIPVKITGDMSEPKIRPDVTGYLRSRYEQEIRDKARDEIEDKLKDKLGDEVGGLLGGLLGGKDKTPEPATEPTPQEPVEEQPQTPTAGEVTPKETVPEAVPVAPVTDEPKQEEAPVEEPVKELSPEEQRKKELKELEQKAKDKLKDLLGG